MNEAPERAVGSTWGPAPVSDNQQHAGSQDEFVFRVTQDRVARQLRMLELNQIPCLADVREDMEMLVTILDRVQKKFRDKGRFHLIMENEVRTTPEDDGQESTGPHVETRILFSPTISFQGPERIPIAEKLADCLNSYALLDRRSTGACALEYAHGNVVPLAPSLPQHPPFTIPKWYPGKEYLQSEVSEQKWQELTQSKLYVNKQLARHFSARDVHDVSQMYKRFFKALHVKIKALNKCRMPRTLVYAEFTPPWIRRLVCVGEQISYLVRLTIPDLRNQRNRAGYQRMAFILAAFYEIEPMFSREILDGLLRSFPPTDPGRRTRKRPMHASQMAAAAKAMARKKRNLSGAQGSGIPTDRREVSDPEQQGTEGDHPSEAQQSTDEEERQTRLELDGQLASTAEGNTRIPVVQPNPQSAGPARDTACGAAEDCFFLRKEVVPSQEVNAITGRCSKCRCPLHDLCGGGEHGDMLCRRCKG